MCAGRPRSPPDTNKILPNATGRSVTPSADSQLKQALEALILSDVGHRLGEVSRLRRVEPAGIEIELGFPAESRLQAYTDLVVAEARRVLPGSEPAVTIRCQVVSHGVQRTLKPLEQVRNIVAVASGKGGVGKSTTAANLALALAAEGARVGVLDADIYGPSQPLMFGLEGQRPTSADGKTMDPLVGYGVQVMSIGFLIDADQPMVWRGPMVTSALIQLLQQTRWDDLDYLVVDMPPGTGDIQLTLSQQVPVSGAVIVTTPQDIALLDARKGLQMFRKVGVPVLGIVENMSTHICSNCGHEEPIFGSGGGARMAAEYGVELLGQLPLDLAIREQTDSGRPTVVAAPDSPQAETYRRTARRMAARLASQGRDYSHRFPKIVVEET